MKGPVRNALCGQCGYQHSSDRYSCWKCGASLAHQDNEASSLRDQLVEMTRLRDEWCAKAEGQKHLVQELRKAIEDALLERLHSRHDPLEVMYEMERRLSAVLSAPTEGEAQSLDDTTRAVLDRAERIVAGQSQQEQRTAEIFLRPTEGEA